MAVKKQVQARVSGYAEWVLSRLTEIRGSSASSELARVVDEWLGLKEDWLEKHGLGLPDFQVSQARTATPRALEPPTSLRGARRERGEESAREERTRG
jgi:hypothetical protein